MSERDYMIVGLCCELCKKQGTDDCPVKTASPWSRWEDFCDKFIDEKTGQGVKDVCIEIWGEHK